MKKNLLLVTFAALYFFPCFSQTLYTNTFETGYRFNPGLGSSGTPIVVFDDVLIPDSLVQGTDSVSITKVNFGIVRLAAAPATTINFYYTPVDDTTTRYATFIKIPPVLIGSINLPANGPDAITTVVSFGDSISKLFAVKTDTSFLYDGYQAFFLGLSFSDSSRLNAWSITEPGAPDSDNDNALWIYDVDRLVPRFASNFGGNPNPSATFYLEVFGSGVTPLPVTLGTFTARRYANLNILNWTTSQELNASHFVIERSTDGRNYVSIGQVAAAGNSTTLRNYTFTDMNPVKGNNYYRIRTVDKDNSSKLSDIRQIRNEGLADISIYPNPASSQLSVAINADRAIDGQMVITDISGKIVYTRSVKLPSGNTIVPVNVNGIAAGAYILKLQLADDVIVRKFNKQ